LAHLGGCEALNDCANLHWPTEATAHVPSQAYLGHRNIRHALRYTELSPTRLKDFLRE
jgi:hypothetical protein